MRNHHALALALLVTRSLSADGNILNNGGFETGLACYQDWIWSQTGVDFAGDYKFSLSSDAHSGSYSLQIACTGADCARAAIYSDLIPSDPGKAYTLSLYSKCPTGTTNWLIVDGVAATTLTCNDNWAANQLNFQLSSTQNELRYYIFNYDKSWLRVDDVVLRYADGSAPATPQTLHAGVRNVQPGNRVLNVDGKPYLSLGWFDVPYRDLAAAAASGATTINGLGYYNNTDCYNTGKTSYLDKAYELNMTFVPDFTFTTRLKTPAVLAPTAARFAPHLANVAWLLADEPDLIELSFTYLAPSDFLAASNSTRTKTSLPIMADMQRGAWGSASDISPYASGLDIWMAEPYGNDFGSVKHAMDLFKSIPNQTKPIWLAQDPVDANLIVPKAYWAIVNGATGIHYFTWQQFQADAAKMAAAQQVFKELKSLNSVIFSTSADASVTPPTGVTTMSRTDGTTTTILAVNPATTAVSGSFKVAGLAAGSTVQVLFENRTLTATAGAFSDAFAGTTRHVYAITAAKGAPSVSATLTNKSGSTTYRDWMFRVTNTGTATATGVKLSSATIKPIGGTMCFPTLAAGVVGQNVPNMAPGGTAYPELVANFTGCDSTSRFTATLVFTATGVNGLLATAVSNLSF